MAFIEAENLSCSYKTRSGHEKALEGLSLSIEEGSFVSITGPNGSGKSTFAKLLDSLEKPESGKLFINGLDASDEENTVEIRKTVGLVFQNPENQIIGDTVEEDIAFGPENMGLEPQEIERIISSVTKLLGIENIRYSNPNSLSGGQKQRLAIASVLAMGSRCIVLDESTSMLDPQGRRDVMQCLRTLNREKGITIINITHNVEECLQSDKVIVFNKGKAFISGSPSYVFSRPEELQKIGIPLPLVVETAYSLGLRTALNAASLAEIIKNRGQNA